MLQDEMIAHYIFDRKAGNLVENNNSMSNTVTTETMNMNI